MFLKIFLNETIYSVMFIVIIVFGYSQSWIFLDLLFSKVPRPYYALGFFRIPEVGGIGLVYLTNCV